MNRNQSPVTVNRISYRRPAHPVVVICVDGGDPSYFEHALVEGIIPNIKKFMANGFTSFAQSAMPSLTNPNNVSIITGVPPSLHGISGNYHFDPVTGAGTMMTDPAMIRCDSVLGKFSQENERVIAITAKEKLRRLLGKGIDIGGKGIVFSVEHADKCTPVEHGISDVLTMVNWPLPNIYSAELSLFVLEAGIRLVELNPPLLMFLSLTDYVQHKYPPGAPESNSFYQRLDNALGRLHELGVVVAVTADHGMSQKSKKDGTPNVIFLQDVLDKQFGMESTKVISPITDPYVAHHGSLGGFARIYCLEQTRAESVAKNLKHIPGIEAIFDKSTACKVLDLPSDIEADVVVVADAATALGTSEKSHDLSALSGHPLRSHGGLSERDVPFILSAPLNSEYSIRAKGPIMNYEILDFAINGTLA